MTGRSRALTPKALVASAFVALVVLGHAACLLQVDESLADRRDAGSDSAAGSIDAESGPDATTTDASRSGMPCGASVCSPRTAVCCTGGFGETDRTKGSCVAAAQKDSDCKSGDWWECMQPGDCASGGGAVRCCANQLAGGGFSKALCEASCAVDAAELCDPSSASPCAASGACVASPVFPGLFECTPR